MLSYRHAFHAGNHADVLKHVVLVEILRHLTAKPKDLWYIETHAGAGEYVLGADASASEAAGGIGRLWTATNLPAVVARYRDRVARYNPDGELVRYPGSPRLAADCLRNGDRLWLHELHPTDHAALVETFAAKGGRRDRRVRVGQRDGLAALRALLPPPPRRALVLVDPSYERKSDYAAVVQALADALRRFATGVYAVWYPVLGRREARSLPRELEGVAGARWLRAELSVLDPADPGLQGSGMFVVNPPHTLAAELAPGLPWLAAALGRSAAAGHVL
ncbi:MAG TPA: 23S rRNA (adenine(2030)-N(6))-methyltransferase RlmJ, partial [Woeseiaceae bacterium]|nr:23S rRNA (adenine(2030)-N(6))-methyltransferase RlmJ [Woeseiaceae bacterium]